MWDLRWVGIRLATRFFPESRRNLNFSDYGTVIQISPWFMGRWYIILSDLGHIKTVWVLARRAVPYLNFKTYNVPTKKHATAQTFLNSIENVCTFGGAPFHQDDSGLMLLWVPTLCRQKMRDSNVPSWIRSGPSLPSKSAKEQKKFHNGVLTHLPIYPAILKGFPTSMQTWLHSE